MYSRDLPSSHTLNTLESCSFGGILLQQNQLEREGKRLVVRLVVDQPGEQGDTTSPFPYSGFLFQ